MVWCDFWAGWLSGMAGFLIGHPIDTIKVRLQIDPTRGSVPKAVRYIVGSQKGSYLSFYRGMGIPLITNGVLNSVFFGFYAGTIHYLSDGPGGSSDSIKGEAPSKQNYVGGCGVNGNFGKTLTLKQEASLTHHFIGGCVGGLALLPLYTPVDLVKIQLQSRMRKRLVSGPLDCVRQIVRAQGILGLYKGFWVQLLRDVPSCGIYFFIYEYFKRYLSPCDDDKLVQFLSGGAAGSLSWLSILPLDVVKSRIQGDSPHFPRYQGMVHCFRVVLREQGIRGLFKGFWPISIRAFPVNGVTFLVYEVLYRECKLSLG